MSTVCCMHGFYGSACLVMRFRIAARPPIIYFDVLDIMMMEWRSHQHWIFSIRLLCVLLSLFRLFCALVVLISFTVCYSNKLSTIQYKMGLHDGIHGSTVPLELGGKLWLCNISVRPALLVILPEENDRKFLGFLLMLVNCKTLT